MHVVFKGTQTVYILISDINRFQVNDIYVRSIHVDVYDIIVFKL